MTIFRIVLFLSVILGLSISSPAETAPTKAESRIAAVVNDKSILLSELKARVRLVTASSRGKMSEKDIAKLKLQVLKVMINELLQIQWAEQFDLRADEDEINQAFQGMEERNGMAPGELDKFLAKNKIPKHVLLQQIRATLVWRKYIRERYRPLVQVSETEIDGELARIEEDKNQERVLLAEIVLPFDPDNPQEQERVKQHADNLVAQLRHGANFAMLANQFSQSASAARGGDIGLVPLSQLKKPIREVISNLEIGELSQPIKTKDRFHIVLLRDKQEAGSQAKADTVITFAQVLFPFPKAVNDYKAKQIFRRAGAIGLNSKSLDMLKRLTGQVEGCKYRIIENIRISQINPQLRKLIEKLPINTTCEPIVSEMGVFLFMVGERKTIRPEETTRETIYNNIVEKRLSETARRELDNLMRSAFIDIRV